MDTGFEFLGIYSDLDVMEVRISAWNGSFGGVARVYVELGGLEDAASALRGFPRDPADTREVTFGTFDRQFAGGGVSLKFYCHDSAGHAFVESKIASVYDLAGPAQSVLLTLPVEAAAVDSFVDQLRKLGANRAGIARLVGAPQP
jgi:hypothetical protein